MDTNLQGSRGENIFFINITKPIDDNETYLFTPCFLGEKWENVDFLIELRNTPDKIYYFFAQIKTSRQGYTKKDKRLIISTISKNEIEKLAKIVAPTYIVGVDDLEEKVYIASANGESIEAISSLSTDFPLNKDNLVKLWQEVRDFWDNSQVGQNFKSNFFDKKWKQKN